MKQDNSLLNMSKIKTNVPGFDDLFYGGLRLPESKDCNDRDGICIVLYGNRGVGKSDLAMQIMRGVDDTFNKYYKITPKFRTLNHRESELKKKYDNLEVSDTLNTILSPESVKSSKVCKCNICDLFPKLKEKIEIIDSENIPYEKGCDSEKMANCFICKLIKHEVINYSDSTQTLHWTFGNSDSKNYLDSLDSTKIQTSEVFNINTKEEPGYTSVSYKLWKICQQEIHNAVLSKDSNDDNNPFRWSAYVIEGFSAFGEDELKRLPYNNLIQEMRKTSAVSILVFDERGKDLHLNADIIINMEYNTDQIAHYTYNQLQIVKCDLQQHVTGWQKYRKMRGLSVKILPSIHSLLKRRFVSDNAVIRLEQKNLKFPQSLLYYSQIQWAKNIENEEIRYEHILRDIMNTKDSRGMVYDETNNLLKVSLIKQEDYDDFIYNSLNDLSQDKEKTISCFLLGKTEGYFRRRLAEHNLPQEDRNRINYWESGLGCIWPEEFASIVKEHIERRKKTKISQKLHIIIDDFSNINLFPFMERERLLVPALVNICRNAGTKKGFDNINDINIELSLVCTSQNDTYKVIKQLVDNQ